jgi:SAM-dependent methyltransferase
MNDPYPAKTAYSGSTASSYDHERFTSAKGRWIDGREKASITKALAQVPRECTILDLPCGTGRITKHVLSLGYRVTGADVSPDMIALARQLIGDHENLLGYVQVDAERIALPSDSYDCITSVRLMGHLPPALKVAVLREMARVARKYLVVTFYKAGPLRSLKWRLTHHAPIRRAAWYPLTRSGLRQLFDVCALRPLGHWDVCPMISDGRTCLLRVSKPQS